MKKKEKSWGSEVDYETPAVEFETPRRETKTAASSTCAPGFCWCGKKAPGCDGSPTTVTNLWGDQYLYVCPNGRDRTSVDRKVFEAAVDAGLVSVKEKKHHG